MNDLKSFKKKKANNTFLYHPSLMIIVVFVTLWFVGNGLLFLSMTDLFTESFFQKKYTMMYFLMIGSTITTSFLIFNYFKNKNSQNIK